MRSLVPSAPHTNPAGSTYIYELPFVTLRP